MSGEFIVTVVGAGPAGLFAAKEILENSSARVLILDMGKHPEKRECSADYSACTNCRVCDVLHGGGGAGLFSDGKLVLDLNAGGYLENLLSPSEKQELVSKIKKTFEDLDGQSEHSTGNKEKVEQYLSKLEDLGLGMRYYNVMRLGTNNLRRISNKFLKELKLKYRERLEVKFRTEVISFSRYQAGFKVCTAKDSYYSDYLVLSVGKSGADWLKKILKKHSCTFLSGNYYFGVRMETEFEAMEDLLSVIYDPKIARVFEDGSKIKIHCACRKGRIRLYKYNGFAVAGGHTEYPILDPRNTSKRSSFNILLSVPKGSANPKRVLAGFAMNSKDKLIVQRLTDFRKRVASEVSVFNQLSPDNWNIVQPGNIALLLEDLCGYSQKMLSFIDDISTIWPGIGDGDNLVYAPVIEWWMDTVRVNRNMQTPVANLYAIGDGAGLSQGIVHAAATGIIAARAICKAIEGKVVQDNEVAASFLSARC